MSKQSFSGEKYFDYLEDKDISKFDDSELMCSICNEKVNLNVNFDPNKKCLICGSGHRMHNKCFINNENTCGCGSKMSFSCKENDKYASIKGKIFV